jgi:hypothetical protein
VPEFSLIGLLDPHREVAGFVGRGPELGELLAWCADGQDAPVRLVIGSAGVGKTRLAVEFARRMRLRGWRSEWLGVGRAASLTGAPEATPILHRKSLVIIDDADRRDGLADLLVDLAKTQPQTRILLLAPDAGGWCDQLELAGPVAHALVTAARSALIDLSREVDEHLTDAELAGLAAVAFATELARPSWSVELASQPAPGLRPMLDLHIAALVAVASGSPGPVTLPLAASELLGLERRVWVGRAEALGIAADPRLLGQLVAAALLLGAATPEDAAAVVVRVTESSGPAALATWLLGTASASAGPASAGPANTVLANTVLANTVLANTGPSDISHQYPAWPRGLAELHIATELTGEPEFARRCLTDLDPTRLVRAVRLLAPAGASDQPRSRPPESALHLVADQLEKLEAPAPALIAVLDALPYPQPMWAQAGAAICDRIVAQLGPAADQGTRAYWLNSLSARLWLAGRQREAASAAEEAVTIRRELAAQAPDRYLASLALSLSYLGIQYAGLDRKADAVKVTQEATSVRRKLAAADPQRYALLDE